MLNRRPKKRVTKYGSRERSAIDSSRDLSHMSQEAALLMDSAVPNKIIGSVGYSVHILLPFALVAIILFIGLIVLDKQTNMIYSLVINRYFMIVSILCYGIMAMLLFFFYRKVRAYKRFKITLYERMIEITPDYSEFSIEVPLASITEYGYSQSFLGKIFRYGVLFIYMSDKRVHEYDSIGKIKQFVDKVRELKDTSRSATRRF